MAKLQEAYAKDPDSLQEDIFAMQKLVQSISLIKRDGRATHADAEFFKREKTAQRLTSIMAATFGGSASMALGSAFKWSPGARFAATTVCIALCT